MRGQGWGRPRLSSKPWARAAGPSFSEVRDGAAWVVLVAPTSPVCENVLPSVPAAAVASGLLPGVVSDPDAERAWAIPGVPFLLILDPAGTVKAKGTVNDLEQLEGLVDTAARRTSETLQGARAG